MTEWHEYETILFTRFNKEEISYERYMFLLDKLLEWDDTLAEVRFYENPTYHT